jgi:hypothetical protein
MSGGSTTSSDGTGGGGGGGGAANGRASADCSAAAGGSAPGGDSGAPTEGAAESIPADCDGPSTDHRSRPPMTIANPTPTRSPTIHAARRRRSSCCLVRGTTIRWLSGSSSNSAGSSGIRLRGPPSYVPSSPAEKKSSATSSCLRGCPEASEIVLWIRATFDASATAVLPLSRSRARPTLLVLSGSSARPTMLALS